MSGLTVARVLVTLCLAAVGVLAGAPVGLDARQVAPRPGEPPPHEDEMRAAERLTASVCSTCHELASVTAERRTASEWQATVEAMATWGAEATAEELTQIRRFLTRTRGLVAVNSAPAAEFAAVLGLPIEVANSVVAYRTTLTRFPDLEALLRVPGLERSPIEQSVQALRFD